MFSNVFVFNNKPQVNYSIVSFEYFIVDVTQMNIAHSLKASFTVRNKAVSMTAQKYFPRTTLFQEL